jgi:hypothetical protein
MNYTVVWVPSAEQELAALWMDAAHRDAVTRAAYDIDQQLRTDAHERGESRAGNQRILIAAPLGVLFTADPQDRMARVLQVWRIPGHG